MSIWTNDLDFIFATFFCLLKIRSKSLSVLIVLCLCLSWQYFFLKSKQKCDTLKDKNSIIISNLLDCRKYNFLENLNSVLQIYVWTLAAFLIWRKRIATILNICVAFTAIEHWRFFSVAQVLRQWKSFLKVIFEDQSH